MTKSDYSHLHFIIFCFLVINLYTVPLMAQETQAQDEPNVSENAGSSEPDTDAEPTSLLEPYNEQTDENGSETAQPNEVKESAFDVDTLVERMKETDAIGVLTKLSLKNQVDDLIEQADEIKNNNGDATEEKVELRENFEGLILKTVTLLNNGEDYTLAEDIYQAREQLWNSIMENKA